MTEERTRRWRLLWRKAAEENLADGAGAGPGSGPGRILDRDDEAMDGALAALYDADGSGEGKQRAAGLGASAPSVARWLGDIRTYFPTGVVQVMQRDAIERLNLRQMLLEPEMLAAIEPDVHLVATLLALQHLLPDTTRATARLVVGRVVDALQDRL